MYHPITLGNELGNVFKMRSPPGLTRIAVMKENKEKLKEKKRKESACEAKLTQLCHVQQYAMKRWEFEKVGGESNS